MNITVTLIRYTFIVPLLEERGHFPQLLINSWPLLFLNFKQTSITFGLLGYMSDLTLQSCQVIYAAVTCYTFIW